MSPEDGRDSSGNVRLVSPRHAKGRWLRPSVFLLVVLGVTALALVVLVRAVQWERGRVLDSWRGRLTAMADDRRMAVDEWLSERRNDAMVAASFPSVVEACSFYADRTAAGERPHPSTAHADDVLGRLGRARGSAWYHVFSRDGRVVSGTTGRALDPAVREAAVRCAAAGECDVRMRRTSDGGPLLTAAAAVRTEGGPPLGAVVLETDPAEWLYPFLASQPIPTRTAETLLVQVEGNEVVFVTPTRHASAPPFDVRRPHSTSGLAASSAVAGREVTSEFVDYRGVAVLAATRKLRTAPWGLVVKVDESEALERFVVWRRSITVSAVLAMLGVAGLAYGLWRHRTASLAEEAARSRSRLAAVMEQANDAIFFLETDGRVITANATAAALYGRPVAELERLSVADLRSSAERASSSGDLGKIVEAGRYTLETVHRRSDGSTFPAEVRARVVELEGRPAILSIVRDIGVHKAAESRIRFLNRLLRTISEINQLIVRERSRDRLLEEACRILVEHGEFAMAWAGFADAATGIVVPAASAGDAQGYLARITVRCDETPLGLGPTGTAVRDRRVEVVNDWAVSDKLTPWRGPALESGFRASAAFPITDRDGTPGALTVYANAPGVIDGEVAPLLVELAGDVTHALGALGAEAARREADTRYRSLFDNMLNGFAYCRMAFDGERPVDFVYLSVNAAFSKLTGLEGVEGRRVTEVIPGIRESDPGLFEVYGRVARSGVPERVEVFVEALKMWFAIAVYRPEPDHFVAVFDVITERKETEQALRLSEVRYQRLNAELEERVRQRTAQLEAANRELEAFSYSVSHDLRAPLRAIDGFSKIILAQHASTLGDEGQRLFRVVRENVHRMGQLVDDLLSFSRMGRVEMRRQRLEMGALALSALSEVLPPDESVRYDVTVGLLPAAEGDPAMLRQVWVNLLANAVKFSAPRERPRIEVTATVGETGAAYTVKDDGVGFDMTYGEKLFGVFSRLHGQTEFPGTGVGLALVKRIVERHDGSVRAEGKVDGGAAFTFTLPLPGNRA